MNIVKIPAFFDLHVHFRDPGFTEKETLQTGSEAAFYGGYSDVVTMPNTNPPVDNAQTIQFINTAKTRVKIHTAACITEGMRGEKLADFSLYKENGVRIITDDGKPVKNNRLMLEAFIEAEKYGLLIADHCEDLDIINGGIVNDGEISRALGLKGMNRLSEELLTMRDIQLAEYTHGAVHICHVSTAKSLQMIREAKERGVRVTCETAPHYFVYTDEKITKLDADYRMNPPLRTESDRKAVVEAIKDGTIDCIATDHAPHTPNEKADFITAPNGVIGLETAFAASYTYLVKTGEITFEKLIDLMSRNPRNIYGLTDEPPLIEVDLDEKWVVEPEKLHSKGRNCVFKGEILYGKVLRD
ncbi:MAG: dihydroorotase [Ruminococcus sp.]|jgi:dihydroorotase|nr:dihydroorotase [Ruminococcus sp.]